MAILPVIEFSMLELVLSFILGLLGLLAAFFGGLWYLSTDHKTQMYDEELRAEIEGDEAFRGIRGAARTKFIVTSDSRISKSIGLVRKGIGLMANTPDKIVVVEGNTIEERQIEMVRERVRDIPGKNILTKNLVAAIRNHYAYKLALNQDSVGSSVAEHFQSRLEEIEHADKVNLLSNSDIYDEVCLLEDSEIDGTRDPLNDIFLRLVEAAERYRINPLSDVRDQVDEIDRCQEHFMLTFFALWTQKMKGIEVEEGLSSDECLTAYRTDIRDKDNWGYWMISREECEEDEFARLRHLAWGIHDIIDDYWRGVNYSVLHPSGDSIREMDQVEIPFLSCLKDERVFRGGGPSGGE